MREHTRMGRKRSRSVKTNLRELPMGETKDEEGGVVQIQVASSYRLSTRGERERENLAFLYVPKGKRNHSFLD